MRNIHSFIAIAVLCSGSVVFSDNDQKSVVSIRNKTDDLHICNGVLIGNNWVLTVASCLININSNDIYIFHENGIVGSSDLAMDRASSFVSTTRGIGYFDDEIINKRYDDSAIAPGGEIYDSEIPVAPIKPREQNSQEGAAFDREPSVAPVNPLVNSQNPQEEGMFGGEAAAAPINPLVYSQNPQEGIVFDSEAPNARINPLVESEASVVPIDPQDGVMFDSEVPAVPIDDGSSFFSNDEMESASTEDDHGVEEPARRFPVGIQTADIFRPQVQTEQRYIADEMPKQYSVVENTNQKGTVDSSTEYPQDAPAPDSGSPFMQWFRNYYNPKEPQDSSVADSSEKVYSTAASTTYEDLLDDGYVFRKKRDVPSTGDRFNVDDIRIHPNFNKIAFNFDVAMIKLDVPEDKLESMHPVYLNLDLDNELGAGYEAIGYGITGDDEFSYQEKLHKFSMNFVKPDICHENFVSMYDDEDHICMVSQDRQPCRGFAGTPVVKNNLLYGLLAYTKDCNLSSPMIAVKIAEYVRYIQVEHSVSYRLNHLGDNSYMFQLFNKFEKATKE